MGKLLFALPFLLPGILEAAKTRPPKKDFASLIDTAARTLKEGKYSEAVWAFQGATQANPSSAQAFYGLGNAYFERAGREKLPSGTAKPSDLRQALEAYETALALDPKLGSLGQPFALYHRMAECYRLLGRPEEAAGALKRGAAVAPHNPMPYVYAAALRHEMRDLGKSSQNLRQALERARRIGQYPKIAKLIRVDPRFSELLRSPQNREMLDLYDDVEAGTRAEAEVRRRLEEGPLRDALSAAPHASASNRRRFLDAMKLDTVVEERLRTADQLFKFNQHRQALEAYQKVLEADRGKGLLDSAQIALIWENMGVCHHHLGQVEAAIDALERSNSVMPHDAGVLYRLALTQSAAGRYPEALKSLDAALKNVRAMPDLKIFLLLSKTDAELTPLRDLPEFRKLLDPYEAQLRVSR